MLLLKILASRFYQKQIYIFLVSTGENKLKRKVFPEWKKLQWVEASNIDPSYFYVNKGFEPLLLLVPGFSFFHASIHIFTSVQNVNTYEYME